MECVIYFYLNFIYITKDCHHVLFYLDIVVSGTVTVFEKKMWRMIKLLIYVIRRQIHETKT